MAAFEGEVYMSTQPSYQVEIWARGKSKFSTAMGPHYSDRRVILFELGKYQAKDPEEEWYIEHHPLYGKTMLNKRVWEVSPEIRQRMLNAAKVGMMAAAAGVDTSDAKGMGPSLRTIKAEQKVGCPYCQNFVRRDQWTQHRDLFHKEMTTNG